MGGELGVYIFKLLGLKTGFISTLASQLSLLNLSAAAGVELTSTVGCYNVISLSLSILTANWRKITERTGVSAEFSQRLN